jgi:hypothetical protein
MGTPTHALTVKTASSTTKVTTNSPSSQEIGFEDFIAFSACTLFREEEILIL